MEKIKSADFFSPLALTRADMQGGLHSIGGTLAEVAVKSPRIKKVR